MEAEFELRVQPCVGCGFCCISAPCSAAVRIYGFVRECPALVWKEERYVCKLMTLDGDLGFRYREELYAGAGCCSNLNSWRREVKPRRDRDLPEISKYKLPPVFAAFMRSLGKEFISSDAVFLSMMRMKDELERSGTSGTEIEAIIKEMVYHYRENRAGYIKNFMG